LPAEAFKEFNPKVNRSSGRRTAGLEENIKLALKIKLFGYVELNSSGA